MNREEKESGAPNPQQAVLASAGSSGIPNARVVAIREINDSGLLFFTQSGTKKVAEMRENPQVSLVFWFEILQREVIMEALIEMLEEAENRQYWESYPPIAQARFLAYAPTSGQSIESKVILEDKKRKIEKSMRAKPILLTLCIADTGSNRLP